MTVANLRDDATADHVAVVFLESARFYRLDRSHPEFDEAIYLLRQALERQCTISIGLDSLDTDVICEVRE